MDFSFQGLSIQSFLLIINPGLILNTFGTAIDFIYYSFQTFTTIFDLLHLVSVDIFVMRWLRVGNWSLTYLLLSNYMRTHWPKADCLLLQEIVFCKFNFFIKQIPLIASLFIEGFCEIIFGTPIKYSLRLLTKRKYNNKC